MCIRDSACPVCSQLNRAGQRGGSGSSVPRPAVCVRASSHTSSNNGKKEVSTTTTQKATRGPWTCGASKKGGSEKRGKGGKNLGPSLIGEGYTPGVWIQNRGPEQEIPAVTRVRLIAQKYQYWHLFHKSYWKFHKSYWKLN